MPYSVAKWVHDLWSLVAKCSMYLCLVNFLCPDDKQCLLDDQKTHWVPTFTADNDNIDAVV